MLSRPLIRIARQIPAKNWRILVSNSKNHVERERLTLIRSFSSSSPQIEKHEFQAETRNLLDIVAKSLYSDQEVFLRELISNSSDALEKRRYAEISQDLAVTPAGDQCPFEIRVTSEPGRLIVEDTGVGMNKEELVNLLGTIARSGSKEFKETGEESKSAESIIGQFGVGFYSAFMVADKVTVITKKHHTDAVGYKWSWSGDSSYEITECDEAKPGCRIELTLRDGDSNRFSLPEEITEVINKYSYFLTVPIFLNGTRVNTMNAIWTLNSNEITPEMHDTFFKQLAKTHHTHLVNDRPRYTVHYKTDAPLNLRVLLYVPSHKVSQLEFSADFEESGVSLYARKVLIKAHAKELLPRYLRFLVGVVDSEDIPLNLSREMLQKDAVIVKLRSIITERVIRFLANEMKKDRIKYTEFYSGYSMFFKEGIVVEQDFSVKEQIARVLLFETSNFKQGVYTSLEEYVSRMQIDQDTIYYLFSNSRQLSESSPYYETFKKENKEVIFIHDAADELVLLMMNEFQGKKFMSVEAWLKQEGMQSENEQKEIVRDVNKKDLLDWIHTSLGSVKVTEIKPISSPHGHPFVITASNHSAMRHVLRVSQPKEMEHLMNVKPVLHVNFFHPVIKGLVKLRRRNEKLAREIVEQVYDNALVTAGLMKDTSEFVPRVNKILGELLEQDQPTILTP